MNLIFLLSFSLPYYRVPLRPKYFPQHPISKRSKHTFLAESDQPIFTPIKSSRQNYSSVCSRTQLIRFDLDG